ncbi:MAG: hypothetical protein ABIH00_09735 [Armatimonadota bacterium]
MTDPIRFGAPKIPETRKFQPKQATLQVTKNALSNLERCGLKNPITGLNDLRLDNPDKLIKDGFLKVELKPGESFGVDTQGYPIFNKDGSLKIVDHFDPEMNEKHKQDIFNRFPSQTCYFKTANVGISPGACLYQQYIIYRNGTKELISQFKDKYDDVVWEGIRMTAGKKITRKETNDEYQIWTKKL